MRFETTRTILKKDCFISKDRITEMTPKTYNSVGELDTRADISVYIHSAVVFQAIYDSSSLSAFNSHEFNSSPFSGLYDHRWVRGCGSGSARTTHYATK